MAERLDDREAVSFEEPLRASMINKAREGQAPYKVGKHHALNE